MFDHASAAALRRPAALVRAARHAAAMRPKADRLHARVLRASSLSATPHLVPRLLEAEAALDSARVAEDPAYSVQTHVEALTALMLEIRRSPETVS